MNAKLKILIIGTNGFLGKELNKFLTVNHYDVYGTTHQNIQNSKVFVFKIGDKVSDNILKEDFHSVVYLAHSYNTEKSEEFIKWYKETFFAFSKRVKKQIYISSYSANEFAVSNYGTTKYDLEQFFIQNNAYSVSPGLIIGKGGIYNKIVNFVKKSPLIVVPVSSEKNLLPIVDIEKVCYVLSDIIQKNFDKKNYNIFTEMISLEDLVKRIIDSDNMKKIVFKINAMLVLTLMKQLEFIGIRLPVTSDSLSGFIENQAYTVDSDLDLFYKVKEK
jgi:nucleoside-diphosphate-sugar epimerase